MNDKSEKIIAVLLPCYNEASTIEKCVRDFRRHLPEADIYLFDNNSTDGSADIARSAGANVIHSPVQGKGNVVRHMFSTIKADIYIMADALLLPLRRLSPRRHSSRVSSLHSPSQLATFLSKKIHPTPLRRLYE